MSATRSLEEHAAQWLMRRDEPDWSAADQAALDGWLDESMAHKAAYWRLEHGWREADRIAALGELAPRSPPVWRLWSTSTWRPTAIAASILVAVAVGTIYSASLAPVKVAQVSFDTPIGGHEIVPLADGSRIELNTQTVVRAAVSDQRREVWLDRGEAYFEVARSDSQPFVVYAGPRIITVLGTKFSVRRDGDKVTVAVVEGRVRVDDANATRATRSATIAGGDVAIARGPSTLITANSTERVEAGLSWRDGMLTFDQSTLVAAAAEFNRYNQRKVIVTDPKAAKIRIGGTFQASNVEAFVRLMRDAYGLRTEARRDGVTISSE